MLASLQKLCILWQHQVLCSASEHDRHGWHGCSSEIPAALSCCSVAKWCASLILSHCPWS